MKLTTIFLLLTTMVIAANSFSQNSKFSINVKDATIIEVFDEIERVTGYGFLFKTDQLDLSKQYSLDIKNANIENILKQLLGQDVYTYRFIERNIVISKDVQTSGGQQQKSVSGKVTDSSGMPLPGVTVLLKGTVNGTITDMNGNYTLPNVPAGSVLQFSFVGMKTQETSVGGKSTINITLEEETVGIEEVVAVGYGVQKKVNLTGAVETVNADIIENRPIRSAKDALQGTALGVTVSSATGEPGQFSKIKIRGESSLNSGGALVLIDGMPGEIDRVNPNDIESISVLKDAASSAIYGARAAEGVILITTKQGKASRTTIEYGGNISYNTPTRIPQSTNAAEHARLSNLAFVNAGSSPLFTDEALKAIASHSATEIPVGNDFIYTADVDWISMMMDHSFQQNHNLSISRSQENLKYLFSAGWLDQNGMFSEYGPDNFDRFNIRSNVNFDMIKDKLNFDSRIVFSRTEKKFHPQFGDWTIPYIVFIQSGPNMPIRDSNGNFARYRMQANPIQALQEGGLGTDFMNITDGIFTLSYKPVKDFTLKAVGGARFSSLQNKEWRRAYGKYGPTGLRSMAAGQKGPNNINQKTQNTHYLTGQLLAEYKKTVGKNEISALMGWSAEIEKYSELRAYRQNIIGNSLGSLELGSSSGWTNNADEGHWSLLSGFMRANYAYASKYLFEANFRTDGSSRFSSKNKWGFFPSFSIGWRLTEEGFMKEQSVFQNIKFRASWGQLGNQNGLGLYDHIPQYAIDGYYPFAGGLAQWAVLSRLPSETRTWETVDMKNIAMEVGTLNNRLTATAEYFIKRNKDMLVNIEVPSIIGINVPTGNYGELEVKGWETSIGWRDKVKDFEYFVSVNLADRKDKLVDYGVRFTGFTSGINQKIQGYSIGSIFGFQDDGYFATDEEAKKAPAFNRAVQSAGDIRYIDKDGDGKITAPNDLVYLGTTQPRYEFGINFGGSWKGIDFSALLQGLGKRGFYLDGMMLQPFRDTWSNYSYTYFSDYWTPENPNALLPRLYAGVKHNYQVSSHWIQNASYIRLKNLQVGYTLKPEWTRKVMIEKFRIYFSGENLFEYSKFFKYYDPEMTITGGYMYPIMRNYSFGINVTF